MEKELGAMRDWDGSWRLQFIKSHIDSHGIGCAIVDDHVVVALTDANAGEADGGLKIKRVRSLDEARQLIGCHCDVPK